MKTATLALLIFTVLDFLNVAVNTGLSFRHGDLTHMAFDLCSRAVSLLFFAGLFYFLLVFYKGQKS